MALNRTGNDGGLITFYQDGTNEGSIGVVGNTINYSAFTGSHYASVDGDVERGQLVALTGNNRYLNGNPASEILYGVKLSTQENDPTILGAFLGIENVQKPHSISNPHLIMAVGNGDMWVADTGQNIRRGDDLISSDVAGHAEKDVGSHTTSYVIARAAEDIDWADVSTTVGGVKHKKISVIFTPFTKPNPDKELARKVEDLESQLNALKAQISAQK